jgi:hypothetical protein
MEMSVQDRVGVEVLMARDVWKALRGVSRVYVATRTSSKVISLWMEFNGMR